MGIKLSIRFFTIVLIVIALLLVVMGIHNYYIQQQVSQVVLILLVLSCLSFSRVIQESQEELNTLVQQRTRDLQNVQNQLLQSEKFSAVGQLAAGIGHELNNPIGFINCNLQTLEKYFVHYRQLLGILNKLEKYLNDKDHERVSQVIASWEKIRSETNFKFMEGDVGNLLKETREGTETMRKIVADLCAFASPDKGTKDCVNLEDLVESMLNISWNEIKYKAQVKKDYGHVPVVICNPQKIGQVFVNLLTNAAHSIEGKGFITIKTYAKGQYVCVDISDTGHGIPPENTNKIFDPFFSTKPVGQGTGLGLSISYDIVRKHGGDMTFSSMINKGTTFTVMLPMECAYEAGPSIESIAEGI